MKLIWKFKKKKNLIQAICYLLINIWKYSQYKLLKLYIVEYLQQYLKYLLI